MNWKDKFKKGRKLILTTCLNNQPHANIVVSLGWINNKILIADCQMKKTLLNLTKNPNLCIINSYYRIKGTAKIFSSGKYFEICVKNNKKYKVKHAILINPKEGVNLDNKKQIL